MRKYGIVWTSASIMWLYTLPHKYLIDLSRQGRQKGVRICLLFHKASSIFIGFHAGVNIESKTFFLPHRPPHIPTHCPALNIYFCPVAPLYDSTMERRNFIGFHEGVNIESKLFFASPNTTHLNSLSGDVIYSGHLLLLRCTFVRW